MRYERSVEVLTRSNTRFDRLFSFERIICVSVCESNYNVGGLLLSTLCTVYTGGARVRLTISQKRRSRNRLPKATHVTYASTSTRLHTRPASVIQTARSYNIVTRYQQPDFSLDNIELSNDWVPVVILLSEEI